MHPPILTTLLSALLLAASTLEAKSMWSSRPATLGNGDDYILKTAYPVGNGRLGGIPYGAPGAETVILNADSLWSGGPFESSSYAGGNPPSPESGALPGIRSRIFQQGTGDVSALLGNNDNYGTYRVLGSLSVTVDHRAGYSDYRRALDLDKGVHTTSYRVGAVDYMTTLFCSNPDDVCVYRINSSRDLPHVSVKIENRAVAADLASASCGDGHAGYGGITQKGPPEGMRYEAMARVAASPPPSSWSSPWTRPSTSCAGHGTLTVAPSPGTSSLALVVAADTNYNASRGNPASGYSFRGESPAPAVARRAERAAARGYEVLLARHLSDCEALTGAFALALPDAAGSAGRETAQLVSGYAAGGDGDPFLESLLFDYARYLLVSSSRENSLPANLQGVWTESMTPSWGGDYHANINMQMNYWPAEQTGLGGAAAAALWPYMEKTWVPRGTETARLLYNATGWVAHDEVNIFGHTAMKDGAGWANYAAAPAWLMQHVWDRFEYGRDLAWLRETGYPLLRGVARFWLSQLQDDGYSRDGSLVVSPCNSPEHGPTTFACAHFQQLIHQLLQAAVEAAAHVGDGEPCPPSPPSSPSPSSLFALSCLSSSSSYSGDASFAAAAAAALARLDRGLHLASWGGIKEWKLPDSAGFDTRNQHRHLSHLVGWFPGHSLAGLQGGYGDARAQAAVRATLLARGTGVADYNTGWAKAWRAACWARLNDTRRAYAELRLLVATNVAANGLAIYSGPNPPFQIDANLGFAGAVLSMLVVDLPRPSPPPPSPRSRPRGEGARGGEAGGEGEGEGGGEQPAASPRTVVLGPAIPPRWGGGSVRNLRLRGGRAVDFAWGADGRVTTATLRGEGPSLRLVNVDGEPLN